MDKIRGSTVVSVQSAVKWPTGAYLLVLLLIASWALLALTRGGVVGPPNTLQFPWTQSSLAAPATFYGYVIGEQVYFGPEEPGRLAELDVDKGHTVRMGAPLFAMDDVLEKALRNEADAAVTEAQSRLERLLVPRSQQEEIDILRARERSARSALKVAKRELDRAEDLPGESARVESQKDKAKAQKDAEKANYDAIRKQIQLAGSGAREEDAAIARSALKVAEARLAASEARLARKRVSAAVDGVIQEVYYRKGEIVPPGRPVVSVLPPNALRVRFFVKERSLPLFSVGAVVSVSCDGCGHPVTARVAFISQRVEFTPPIIYSNEERAKLVFMLEALPGETNSLRVGQPATITLPSAPDLSNAPGRR
jgi:HlyD family secretion protein